MYNSVCVTRQLFGYAVLCISPINSLTKVIFCVNNFILRCKNYKGEIKVFLFLNQNAECTL